MLRIDFSDQGHCTQTTAPLVAEIGNYSKTIISKVHNLQMMQQKCLGTYSCFQGKLTVFSKARLHLLELIRFTVHTRLDHHPHFSVGVVTSVSEKRKGIFAELDKITST